MSADAVDFFQRLRASLASRRWPSRRSQVARARQPNQRVPIFVLGIFALLGFGALAACAAMLWALNDLPVQAAAVEANRPAILLEAPDGQPLGRVGPLKTSAASREDFPEHLVQAVLSIEDRRFYSHFGVDPLGIVRALRRNAAAGEIVEGGSTITQQLMKMQIGNDRTYTRKLREALKAVWLELRTDKDEILTRYLNSIYMGAGAHGMTAAARLYFDKAVSELTLAESAMLAGMIKAPSQFNPLRDLESARTRAATVVDAMLANGAIDEQAASDAKARPATLRVTPGVLLAGSWFADWVAKETAAITAPFSRSVRVRTTLVPKLQQLAERVIADELGKQGGRSVSQAALVALRPDGAVLAMVGGRDYDGSQFNRATEANRHPGSAFKLFVYMAALQNGYSPNDTIDAGPIDIKGWRPDNFDGQTYGRMTLADAFARSINTAAVRLATEVGLNKVIAAARDLGIDARLAPVPSMALGAVEVSLLDLTGAFASVQAGRKRVEPWGISAFGMEGETGLRTLGPHLGSGQLGPQQKSMVDLLRLVVERGTGRAAALNGFAAGKTGTSQNHRDAWFIGFNEALVVGVWVGNDDGTPMERVVGGTLPATIWRRFVSEATGLLGPQDTPVANAPVAAAPPANSAGANSSAANPLIANTPIANAPLAAAPPPSTPAAPAQATNERVAQETPNRTAAGQCDYRACGGMYQSFRASDCTYQPYSGPRTQCLLGASNERIQTTRATGEARGPEGRGAVRDPEEHDPEVRSPARQSDARRSEANGPEARGEAQCNIDACAQMYRSFNSSDCTYQPHDGGPRRMCEK